MADDASTPLLEVADLETYYQSGSGWVHAVDGVNFTIEENETIGLVGESGSGKSTVARALLQILPDNGEIVGGSIKYKGRELVGLPNKELRKVRWNDISMIPQNAMNGFDPVYTVGEQIVEAIRTHRKDATKKEARERARELFESLGIDEDRLDDYPHQYSGGMAQRAMIALAISLRPPLIIADEPTTALDVVMQDKTMATIKKLVDDSESAMILITHDMSVVSEVCDRIAVMYGGRIVEFADTEQIIKNPRHPYTLGLRNAFPDISDEEDELISIPGTPPNLVDPEPGCRFAPRCPFAEEECWDVTPQPEVFDENRIVECHRADEAEFLRRESTERSTWRGSADD
jgi:peptide/nickel transport system ATP-binding protein